MGRKPQRPRPTNDTSERPQGEQELSTTLWEQMVKAIRALKEPRAA